MRKIYLLLTMLAGMFVQNARAADTASFNFSINAGNLVVFNNTSVLQGNDVRKAYWSFGDGIRIQTAPLAGTTHTYANFGVYTVCLRIYKYSTNGHDSTISGESCHTLTLQPTTTADSCSANFSDTLPTTASGVKVFVAQPWHNHNKKPEQICWTYGDGTDTCINYNPSLANNYAVYHHYVLPGQYNVCVKIKYQGGCISTYCHITTIPGDICKADYNVEPVTASPMTRHFVALPWHILQKKVLRVCWNFGDGHDTCIHYTSVFAGPFVVNHTYGQAGQYNVCVKILYDGGCESQKCKITTITTPPPPPDTCFVNLFEVAGNVNNIERHFYIGTPSNKVPEKICWYFGDGNDSCIILPSPVPPQALLIGHHYPAPGVYHVCVKVWYVGGCIAYKCIEINIHSSTNICGGYMTDSLTAARTYLFKGFSVLNANDHVISWRWTFGDGTIATTQQATHTYANGGNYEVCLTIRSDLGCETRICKHIIVQASNNQPQLVLTPNPVSSNLHAVFQSMLQEQVTISIYNANGVMVRNYSRSAVAGTNTWDFDVASLPSGIYTVIVHSSYQLANAIFFKQ